MNKIALTALMFVALPCLAATNVAVMETVAAKDAVGNSEKSLLTDVLWNKAKKALPEDKNFVVISRDSVKKKLPSDKSFEYCVGKCLIDAGKKVGADYIAQARVGKVDTLLTLNVDLFDTKNSSQVKGFTALGKNSNDLVKEIENRVDSLFVAIGGNSSDAEGDEAGISGLKMGSKNSYQLNGAQSFILKVSSEPAGATLEIDGKPAPFCKTTPCDVQLKSGNHSFKFTLEQHLGKDTVFNVSAEDMQLKADLPLNLGNLTIAPKLTAGIGDSTDLNVSINGKEAKLGVHALAPGSYKVAINHRCYEPVEFTATIKRDSDIKFDKELLVLMGGLELSAVSDSAPKALPVFVNGEMVGKTPLLKVVPVCSMVEIGDEMNPVPLALKAGEKVEYTYVVKSMDSAAKKADSLYSRALTDLNLGGRGLKSAYSGFRQVYDMVKTGELAENALYGMALCLLEAGQPDKAKTVFARLIESFPNGVKTCAALLKLATIFGDEDNATVQNEYLQKILSEQSCKSTSEYEQAEDMLKKPSKKKKR